MESVASVQNKGDSERVSSEALSQLCSKSKKTVKTQPHIVTAYIRHQ